MSSKKQKDETIGADKKGGNNQMKDEMDKGTRSCNE